MLQSFSWSKNLSYIELRVLTIYTKTCHKGRKKYKEKHLKLSLSSMSSDQNFVFISYFPDLITLKVRNKVVPDVLVWRYSATRT